MNDKRPYKRKRLARPRTLVLFGIIFLVLPFINYFALAAVTRVHWSRPDLLYRVVPLEVSVLLLVPFVVGAGLLMVTRWGWRLFLVYAAVLIVYNIYAFVVNPAWYNLTALLQVILGTAAVIYFTREDIAAPYMKVYPRGWRMEKRLPVEIPVSINDVALKTRDFSPRGFYVDWKECPHQAGDEVRVQFSIGNVEMETSGGIVRVEGNGAGIAFRDLSDSDQAKIRAELATRGA